MLLITAQTKQSYTAAQDNCILMICVQKECEHQKAVDEDSPGMSAAFWVMGVFQHTVFPHVEEAIPPPPQQSVPLEAKGAK